MPVLAQDQTPAPTPPAADASCTVAALNRSAPLEAGYEFTLYNLPGAAAFVGPGTPPPAAPFRVRVVCSDGTVGETALAYPAFGDTVVYTGDIVWGRLTPIAVNLALEAAQGKLRAGEGTQLRATGILSNGQTADMTARESGTLYTSSNQDLASVDGGGAVAAAAQLASNFSARVVMTAQNEGVSASRVLQVGGLGAMEGRVLRADGVTPVAGARVSILGERPRQLQATLTTDANGRYRVASIGVGSYTLSVTDPATGDVGTASGGLAQDGDTATLDVLMNGQGTVNVTVLDGDGAPLANSAVTFTTLGDFRDVRTLPTGAGGQVVFERVPAGLMSVSTRNPANRMVAALAGRLVANGSLSLVLKLQPTASISGFVFGVDGATAQEGVQLRVVSLSRGIVAQTISGADGAYGFEGLTLADAPYSVDAMLDGRLRARVPNLVFTAPNQQMALNLVFAPAGRVAGVVSRSSGEAVAGVKVTLQSQVGQRFSFETVTDEQGRYAIDGVAVGAFSISAVSADKETASASGTIGADGETVSLNLQLASNGIVGTVFLRNGTTAVGEGVNVKLQPLYGHAMTTSTNAQGRYSFNVTQPSTYTITASDNQGNLGYTSVVLTAIVAGDPKTVDVVYLARGTVQGTVRDPSGVVQGGVQVTVSSTTVPGVSYSATTDNQGVYRIVGVFAGEFTVYAKHPATLLAGLGRGRVADEGSVANADVTLAATGTVNGTVVARDGSTAVPNAVVEVRTGTNGGKAMQVVTGADGAFSLLAVPLGEFRLHATNPANGDQGETITRLVTANEVRTANVRLLGVGQVRVHAQDGAGQPVAGAEVTVTSQSQFGGDARGLTDAQGDAVIGPVFNGDFTVTAAKGSGLERMTAGGSGAIVDGVTAQVSLTLVRKPVAKVSGIVTKGLGALPQAGVAVSLDGSAALPVTTGADGAFSFESVEAGKSYALVARIGGQVRAKGEVTIGESDQAVVRNLVLLGIGSVQGTVRNAQGAVQAATLELSNSDPTYGGRWQTQAGPDGRFRLDGIPVGSFVLRATSMDLRATAQERGQVQVDGDLATLDLSLVDNARTMPVSVYDANGALFDVQGNGSLANGVNSVFQGNNLSDKGAARLELLVNGVPQPFLNGDGTLGRVSQDGQLVEVDELQQASGLNVTRRIYVPKYGYFARYMEILENRTAAPVTVGVRIVSNFAQGKVGSRVVDTSSGDAVLDVVGGDRWLIVDDEDESDPFLKSNNPSVALVFDGAKAARRVDSASMEAVGAAAKVKWQWDQLTVQPGERVALLHFLSQQLGRAQARAAAERLSQLPPEALEGLSAEERAMVRNFTLPADGLSPLPALPALDGNSVGGTVYAGDGNTPIANALVTVKSDNLLFGRSFQVNTDKQGHYALSSHFIGLSNLSVALAYDSFSVTAVHPSTGAIAGPNQGQFAAGSTAAQQDLVYSGTGILKGVVRRHSGALVTDGKVSIPYMFPGANLAKPLYAPIDAAGNYQMVAIEPGNYLVSASQPHPQGKPILGVAPATVFVPAGQSALRDVTMEVTGELTGNVRSSNGEAVVGASILLDDSPEGPYRSTQTDSGGNYRLTDVALGTHAVKARGVNGLEASGSVAVTADLPAVLDLRLAGIGQLRVRVNYARGVPAIGAPVGVAGVAGAVSDSAGIASFSVPTERQLSVTASHPDNGQLVVHGSTTLAANGDTVELPLVLPPAATISGTVYRPDGATPAPNIRVTLRRQDGGLATQVVQTGSDGSYRFRGLALANYMVSAEDLVNRKFADVERALTTDGEEASVNLKLADNRVGLPADLRDGNDFLFDIQQNGAIGSGWRARIAPGFAVYQGGAQLEINGLPFTGDTSAALDSGRRQFSITQAAPLAGLNVTRKVFVPRGGYFARYLEVLDNPGAAPLTVAVKLRSKYTAGNAKPVETSSGTAAPQASDSWVIVDDNTDADPFISASAPATALVAGGAAVRLPHDQLAASQDALELGWSAVTVPAQGRVVLMHFAVQQVSRAGARAAAQRLLQLPPEAVAGLSADDLAAVANFSANGAEVAPLPNLQGSLAGVAYEGDHQTVVPGLLVQVRSTHPLFGRTWLVNNSPLCDSGIHPDTLRTGANGSFSLAGAIQETGSIALPVGFDIEMQAMKEGACLWYGNGTGHPQSHIASPVSLARFAEGSSVANGDVVFDSAMLSGTVLSPTDFGVGAGTVNVRLASGGQVTAAIQSNGSYALNGMPPGSYTLTADVPHNQGTSLLGVPTAVTLAVGQRATSNLALEATGSIGGAVLTASGTAAVGAPVAIAGSSGGRTVQRSTVVDSLGRYYLSAVPVGSYQLTVTDPRTGASVTSSLAVSGNQAVVQDALLPGVSNVRVTVKFARGAAAGDIPVYLSSSAVAGGRRHQGYTDSQGNLTVAVPVGSYELSAYSPGDSSYASQWVAASGTVSANNEALNVALTLKPHAAVHVTVVDRDASNAVLANARVYLTDAVCPSGCDQGATDSRGQLLMTNVHQGTYTVMARAADGRTSQVSGTVTAAEDGKTLEEVLAVSAVVDRLGVLSFGTENQLYSVPARAGDVITVNINGTPVNGGAASYTVRARVYAPDKALLARGYGYDSRNSNVQYNEQGNLLNIVAPQDGNYPITVSPYSTSQTYLGGYRLQVKVNGVAVATTPYLDGGSVQGNVSKGDTTPAANAPLEISSSDVLAMRVRLNTDALGAYRLGGVPLGTFTVAALEPSSLAPLVSGSGQLATLGDAAVLDLALPKRTTVQLQVAVLAPLSVPSQMYVTVKDARGTLQDGPLTFAGGSTISDVRNIVVYGDQPAFSVVHPSNTNATASASVQGADGQSVPLTLTLAFTGIQGTVYNSANQPMASAYVRAYVLSTRRSLGTMYTNSSGLYSFANVPAGEEILVQAQDPANAAYVSGRTTLQPNQANVLDIRLPGNGQITGRLLGNGGTPVPNTYVHAQYVYDDINNYNTSRDGYTAADGSFTITSVPSGRPVQLYASISTLFGTASNSRNLTLQPGESVNGDLLLALPSGSLLVRLVDTDGQSAPSGVCYQARVTASNGSTGWTNSCSSDIVFKNVPAGQASVSAVLNNITFGPQQVTVTEGQQLLVPVAASVVKGTVRFAEGPAVANPSVSLMPASGGTLFAQGTSSQGEYRILGVPLGNYTLKAEDTASALRTQAAGAMASLATPVRQDLVLPLSATVSGIFRDIAGQPVANADVYVRSNAVDVDRSARTSAAGGYSVAKVAQGHVTALGRDPLTKLIASGEGELGAAGLAINLTVPESTVVGGTVVNDGTPVSNSVVTLNSVKTYGPFGPVALTATTDDLGRYEFAAAPIGDVRTSVTAGNLVGSALGTTVSGQRLQLDLLLGGSINLPYTLRGADTSLYDVTCQGTINDGGYASRGDAFDGGYMLSVAGNSFPCASVADLKTGARELVIGPYVMSGLKVTRRIFSPAAGLYGRYVETLENPSASPITVAVAVTSNLGSDGDTRMAVSPAASGGRYAVTTDGGSDPALGHVFASTGAELVGTQSFNVPSDTAKYNWTVTVPAGGAVSLLHFVVQRNAMDVNAVQQQAEALANMTQGGMFDGLSADDKLRIKNFKVSQ